MKYIAPSFCLAGFLALSTLLPAADSSWTNTSGGLFTNGANWSDGVPGGSDVATFNTPAETYTVTFDQDVSTGLLRLGAGNITFQIGDGDQNQYLYTANGFQAGHDDFPPASSLTITDGTLRLTGSVQAGHDTNRSFDMIVTGANSKLEVSGEYFVRRANTVLTVNSGASFEAGNVRYLQRGTSSITFDDATGSVTGTMTLGDESTVNSQVNLTLNVQNAATLSVNTFVAAIQTGTTAGPGNNQATTTVTGNGSVLNVNGTMTLGRRQATGGGSFNPDTDNIGTLNILDGGRVNSGTSGTFNMTVGWDATNGTGQGVGNVTISGENSLWHIGGNSSLRIAHNGGRGTVTVATSGVVGGDSILTGGLDVAGNITLGTDGTLQVNSGTVRAGGNMTLVSGSVLGISLADSDTNPLVTLGGIFDPDSATLSLDLASGFSISSSTVFTLVAYDSWTGEFFDNYGQNAEFVLSEGGNDWDAILNYGTNALTLTVIPEPTGLVLLAIGLGLIMVQRRRQQPIPRLS